jgi:tripartite-type tricarboxylate transporter receptor subunit TctC
VALSPDRTLRKNAMLLRPLLIALAIASGLSPALAEGYPDRPIKIVVPFAPGGGTDVLARIIAQKLNEKWGQPVVVDNQPGASGGIGTRAVVGAAPDGYTLLMASTGALMAAASSLGGDGAFDVTKYLAPITVAAAPPYLLVVSPKVQATSAADLIRISKDKPESLTFGSSGVGAASHLSGVLFESEAGIKMLHVPYKGTGPGVTDLLAGRIDLMFAPGPVVQSFVQAGQLKAIGVTDSARSQFYPEVPTISESGLLGYESVGWFGLLAPAKTPPDIVKQLNEALVSIMQTKEFREHLAILGAEPKPQTPEEFARYINADVAKWTKLVKDNNIILPGAK